MPVTPTIIITWIAGWWLVRAFEEFRAKCEASQPTKDYPNMRVRKRGDELGITISGKEYIISVAEADRLIGMINAVKHEANAT